MQPSTFEVAEKPIALPASAAEGAVALQPMLQEGVVVDVGHPASPCQQRHAALRSGTSSPEAFWPPAPVGWLSPGELP